MGSLSKLIEKLNSSLPQGLMQGLRVNSSRAISLPHSLLRGVIRCRSTGLTHQTFSKTSGGCDILHHLSSVARRSSTLQRYRSKMATSTATEAPQWNAQQVRDTFLQFFKDREHTFVKSSSVVPLNDPTILFSNAVMSIQLDVPKLC